MQASVSFRAAIGALALTALAGCTPPGDAAFHNRGGPDSLLDVSSEVVNLSAASSADLQDLSNWIERDAPTRAELNCIAGEPTCTEARKILELEGVPVVPGSGNDGSVTLVYERILARDCNARYVDNPHNVYNTYHPSFGCSVAANMVQQVTDKQEFISPSLSDDAGASRAVNDMRRAYKPRPVIPPYTINDSLTKSAKSD